jgi:hypothetical protein
MSRPHYHTAWKRGVMSLGLIATVLGLGTWGMMVFEKMPVMDAFYFMSMIATAQGSAYTPQTTAGKLFASLISFVSVGAVVAALGFLFGPFLGKLWHLGARKVEDEIKHLEKKN